MTWSKLSDDYSDDCWGLSDAAFRLHTEAIVWSNRKLLDLRIPRDDLRRFKCPEAVQELLDHGFWTDFGSYFEILHHSDYQRSREAVLATQSRSRTNGSKGGRPKKREIWQGNKTQQQTPNETPKKSQQETQQVSKVSTPSRPENAKTPGITGEQNPAANLIANPKGLAFNRSSSTEGSLENDPWLNRAPASGARSVESDPSLCANSPHCDGRLTDAAIGRGELVCNQCKALDRAGVAS